MRLHRRPPAGPDSCHGDRVASKLHVLARYGEPEASHRALPRLSQEVLAEMVGTTRSRVNFFMNKFWKLGFIDYGCDSRPTSVEEPAAAEQQHHEDDDEQSGRVHFSLPYGSRVIRHPTVCGEHEPVSVQLRTPLRGPIPQQRDSGDHRHGSHHGRALSVGWHTMDP